MISKFSYLFIYYIVLFIGLILMSWILWVRFFRERTIRDIPDIFFSEYRFWILLYICCIYIYLLKILLIPKPVNPIIQDNIRILQKKMTYPIKTLDQGLKYNRFLEVKYLIFMDKIIDSSILKYLKNIIIFLNIIPRSILVLALVFDTFFFHRIEIFYKFILLGILPFTYKYLKYSLEDLLEYYIKELEVRYSKVEVYEEGYKLDVRRSFNTNAIHHYKIVSIREYIDIKFENTWQLLVAEVNHEYNGMPYDTEESTNEYLKENYNCNDITKLTISDYKKLEQIFHCLMPTILDIKILLNDEYHLNHDSTIAKTKIIIIVLYLICWLYILIKNYIYNPIELVIFKTFINKMLKNLYYTLDIFNNIF